MFGIGNLLLKLKRRKLPRPERARGMIVVAAIVLVSAAFYGNMLLNPGSFFTFIRYLVPALLFAGLMLNRANIVMSLIEIVNYFYGPLKRKAISAAVIWKNCSKKFTNRNWCFLQKAMMWPYLTR